MLSVNFCNFRVANLLNGLDEPVKLHVWRLVTGLDKILCTSVIVLVDGVCSFNELHLRPKGPKWPYYNLHFKCINVGN
jgi:hypothetical protein